MEDKPAEIIRQAREKAESVLMQQLADEITRICNAFTYDTGLNIGRVDIVLQSVNTIGGKKEQITTAVNIRHEDV